MWTRRTKRSPRWTTSPPASLKTRRTKTRKASQVRSPSARDEERHAAARYTDRRHHPVVGFMTIWDEVLDALRPKMPAEDFRRWFGATAYASDSGDQITVWVPTESIRRHMLVHFQDAIKRALVAIDRRDTHVRLVVSGTDEDDEDDEDDEAR